jgi:cyclin-dependent kinase
LDRDVENAKIGDFGLARYVTSKHNSLTREVETLWYRAPEVMLGMKQYTFAIDVWAIGCTFAELFLKRPLFLGAESEIEQLFKVFEVLGTPTVEEWPALEQLPDYTVNFPKWKKKPLSEVFKNIDGQALNLIESMLVYDPEKRITVAEALNHPYLL